MADSSTPAPARKSFIDALKDAVIERVDDAPKPAPKTTLPPPTPLPFLTPSPLPAPVADPEALARLEDVVRKSMPPGYANFVKQMDVLAAVTGMSTDIRVQAAFATAGISKQDLSSGIDACLKVVASAKSDFYVQFNQQKAKLEDPTVLAAHDAAIRERQTKIAELQQQVEQAEAQKKKYLDDVKEKAEHIEQVRAGFEAAVATMEVRLESQRAYAKS